MFNKEQLCCLILCLCLGFSSFANTISRDGLVVEYLFDDASQPGKDSSPNLFHASSQGSPTLVQGKIGQALFIDELSDALDNVPGFDKGQMTTFNLWFKTNISGHLFHQSYWQASSQWELIPTVRGDNGHLEVWAYGYNGARDDFNIASDGQDYRDNQWHMLTIVTDGISGKAYVDGQLYGQDNFSQGPSSWSNNQEKSRLKIGEACAYGHNNCSQWRFPFEGLIDNYRMYNRALTEEEIGLLFYETEQVLNMAPVAVADNFTLKDKGGVTELDVLANDTDEDKASLAIRITNQSGLGGSATVSGQKISYTPQPGYKGEDWIEYQLIDKEGFTSDVVRVGLLLQGKLSADIFSDGLIAEYLFEDPLSAGYDNSTHHQHAIVQQQANNVVGQIGQAIEISSSSEVLKAIPGFDKGHSISFNLWFKTAKGGYLMQQEYWRKGYLTETWALLPSVRGDNGKLEIWALGYGFDRHGSGGWARDDLDIVIDDQDYRDDLWHMLTIVTDGSGGKAYIDGEYYAKDDFSFGPPAWAGNQDDSATRLGGSCVYAHDFCKQGEQPFQGQLDNFRMYNKALTEQEIKRLYHERAGDVNQPPVALADEFTLLEIVNPSPLDILTNDWDEVPANLSIRIMNQGGLAGTANVSGQQVIYTPEMGYKGDDWFEYQLTDEEGLNSEIVRVDIRLNDNPFANGLMVEYLFEDPTFLGRDSSGKGADASVIGSPDAVPGRIGLSLETNESSDVLLDVPGFNKGQVTSFNLWFKTSQGGYLMQQSYWVNNSSAPVWELIPSISGDNGQLNIWAFGWAGGARDDLSINKAEVDYRDNQWHMLTIITDGISGKAYIDGQLYGEDSGSVGPSAWQAGQVTSMTRVGGGCVYGHNGCGQGEHPFNGFIDNYRMYDRALSEDEIQALYAETKANVPNFPVRVENDSYELDWNNSVLMNVVANDTEPQNFTLEILIREQTSHGSLNIQGNRVLYTPETDYFGKDSFSYQLKIGSVYSDIAQVELDIFKGTATMPTLEPGGNHAPHQHIHYKGRENDKIYVEVKSQDQDVTLRATRTLWDAANNPQRETSKGTNFGYIVEGRTRLEVMAFGEGYRDSSVNIVDYYYVDPLRVNEPTNGVLLDASVGCDYRQEVMLEGGYGNANVIGDENVPDWMILGIAHHPSRVVFKGKPQQGDVTTQPLNIKVDAIDGFESEQSFTVNLSVNAGNRPPVVNEIIAINGPVYARSQEVQIQASASDLDAGEEACGGDLVKKVYLRLVKEGELAGEWQTMVEQPWVFNFGQLAVGNYKVEAKAEDGAGAQSEIQSLAIEVKSLSGAMTFEWAHNEIIVGQQTSLKWIFKAGKICRASTETQNLLKIGDMAGVNDNQITYTPYKSGEHKAVWLCDRETEPVEAILRVNKISAPANLRQSQ